MDDKRDSQIKRVHYLIDASSLEHASLDARHQTKTDTKKDGLVHKSIGIAKGGKRHYHKRGYQGL